jgi:chemotaxis protein CheZ
MTGHRPVLSGAEEGQEHGHGHRAEEVFGAVSSVSAQLEAIERFVARRFDEISMEINATSQQVDMAEEGIINRFSEILEVLHAISYKGGGNTPANAGVELDAVVEMTEQAANRILDAADRITGRLHAGGDWGDETQRQNTLDEINRDVEEIFMACSFQDITGQRIRKTLENLQLIEDRLGTALSKMGIKVEGTADTASEMERQAASQDDVDALFSESRSSESGS